jgi:hypothetical protein
MNEDLELALSTRTLEALQEFLKEKDDTERKFKQFCLEKDNSMNLFQEDWNLSQFWYDDVTATELTTEILDVTHLDSKIACICTPTIYCKLRVRAYTFLTLYFTLIILNIMLLFN